MAALVAYFARRLGALVLSAFVVAFCAVGAFAVLIGILAILGRVAG
jgi:hypothetical protein